MVVDEWKKSKVTIDDIAEQLKKFTKKYKLIRIFCDPAEKMEIEFLRKQGLPVWSAKNDVLEGIFAIKRMFENGSLVISQFARFILHELSMYSWDEDKEKPIKHNDHLMDALRYAIMGVQRKPVLVY